MIPFDYDLAFSRNIGWVTPEEQQTLKGKRVAIAGMGGVGGVHLLTLMRLGVTKVHIADFDRYDVANFNRQAGAFMSTVGKTKAEVMYDLAMDINPEAEIKVFKQGVSEENLDEFLNEVDHYLDGLDFFVLDIREKLFARAYELKIPCTSVAPIAMGAALVNIVPGKMSFDQYFGLSKTNIKSEKAVRFALGLSPKMPHASYIKVKESFDLIKEKAPSTSMGCQLASGVAVTECMKFLLGRGNISCAPKAVHFDAYSNKIHHTWTPFGFKNPIQRFKLWLATKLYGPKVDPELKNQEI